MGRGEGGEEGGEKGGEEGELEGQAVQNERGLVVSPVSLSPQHLVT